jgi:hypothetical protein
MMRAVVLAFRGKESCFLHAMLNVIDMKERGLDVAFIIEGEATKTIASVIKPDHKYHQFYEDSKGSIVAVCEACSKMAGTLDIIKNEGLPIVNKMKGHVPLATYVEEGYCIITF